VTRLLVVQHEDAVPLGRMRFPGLALDVVRPDRGDPLPDRLTRHAGLVVLGGTMAAWEDDVAPWLPATRALLAACVDDGTPVLGICLGAQLLALATGGAVERGPAGPELGVVDVARTTASDGDHVLGGLGAAFPAASGHHDAVTALPSGAVQLARTATYPHQAFRLGDVAWGVQYHPEATAEVLAGWLEPDRALLAARGTTPEALVAEFARRDAELAAVCRAHADAFTAVVTARSVTQPLFA
jgi:GMP synthase (glutamine-hydrolysing)